MRSVFRQDLAASPMGARAATWHRRPGMPKLLIVIAALFGLGIDIDVIQGKGLALGASQADRLKVTSASASTTGVELVGGKLTDSTVALPVNVGPVNRAVASIGSAGTSATIADDDLAGERV